MRDLITRSRALVRTEAVTAHADALLRYVKTDPCAVSFTVAVDGRDPVTWVFARDLLAAGLEGPAGEGDVHIAHDGDNVHVSLSGTSGWALIQVPAPMVRKFLQASYALVPAGGEVVDVDQLLAALTEPH